jgi:hypothetical protein
MYKWLNNIGNSQSVNRGHTLAAWGIADSVKSLQIRKRFVRCALKFILENNRIVLKKKKKMSKPSAYKEKVRY